MASGDRRAVVGGGKHKGIGATRVRIGRGSVQRAVARGAGDIDLIVFDDEAANGAAILLDPIDRAAARHRRHEHVRRVFEVAALAGEGVVGGT